MTGLDVARLLRAGTYYYADRDEAERVRAEIGADRVVVYELGYAVQWHKSGPYYGPDDLAHSGCLFCSGAID